MCSMSEPLPPTAVTPPAAPRHHSPDALQAFLDQARSLAEWHRQRSDNFESKAGAVLGLAGVILALTTQAIGPVGDVRGGWQFVLVVLVGLSAIAFVASGVFAVRTLRTMEYRYASTDQLRRVWSEYKAQAGYADTQILGMFADSLICGDSKHLSPIESLKADAKERGKQLGRAIRCLFVGLGLEATATVVLAIEVWNR
jgi:hypothetical protein